MCAAFISKEAARPGEEEEESVESINSAHARSHVLDIMGAHNGYRRFMLDS